jgi:hypothetical protein
VEFARLSHNLAAALNGVRTRFGDAFIYSRFGLTKLLASAEIAAISDASSLSALSVPSSTE